VNAKADRPHIGDGIKTDVLYRGYYRRDTMRDDSWH